MMLDIAIYVFAAIELINVLILYFKPDFPYGNSVSVFKAWAASKQDDDLHLFMRYLVSWVANCKLIFIALLLVIALFGNEALKIAGVIATIVSIGIYFITLHPLIRKLDRRGEINPSGYSKSLGLMIGGFMAMFSLALALHFILG
jgi:hypothetical protein